MALRDQPYLPLYIQDYLTDEKLNMCSASTQGVFIKIMCIMHKSEEYGIINLKTKYKQNKSNLENFADMLMRLLTFDRETLFNAISELIEEDVLFIEGNKLCQKRMMYDGAVSGKRATAGATGGKKGRNSGMKRFYNEEGYLYLIYDKDDTEAFKVGISKEPEKRISGIIRKEKRKNLQFRRKWHVKDMGKKEQEVLDYFDDIRDGEWIFGSYDIESLESQIDNIINNKKQNKSKTKANSEDEDEDEDVNSSDINKNWKNNFNIYLQECKQAYKKFVEDENKMALQKELNPGVNVELSIKKGFTNFWGNQRGWNNKKKKKIKNIDWEATIINSIALNKVYLQKK